MTADKSGEFIFIAYIACHPRLPEKSSLFAYAEREPTPKSNLV